MPQVTSTPLSALSLIDEARYPIHQPDSTGYGNLVTACRESLKDDGACLLPAFTTPQATARMAQETSRVVGDAYLCRDAHTVYLNSGDPAAPENHPLRRLEQTELHSVAYDQVATTDALYLLYNWDPFLRFLADVLERKTYYRMADPLAALTVNVMNTGQNHGWHFDEAEVTTTLLLQAPELGGSFQYIHNLRTADYRGYEGVSAALDDTHPDVRTLEVKPGTLLIFAGYYSLHRVTPVVGATTRYLATFCFKDRPGVRNSPEVQKLFYGRTAL